jgi:hypothetical protein
MPGQQEQLVVARVVTMEARRQSRKVFMMIR